MDANTVTQLILEYRYLILVPLSVIEGPIVAFAAGTLASLGYFNIFALAAFFFVMDLMKDAFYYSVGYWGGRTRWARWLMKKIGVKTEHIEGIRQLWEKHAGKTMFLGKLSYGIASTFVVFAGTVKMPLKKFFGWGAIVAIAQYWVLLGLGYFFGQALAGATTRVFEIVQYAIAGVSVAAILYYIFSFYMRKEFKKETEE
jgi:membrane protein DedA with SNARE-associated domain